MSYGRLYIVTPQTTTQIEWCHTLLYCTFCFTSNYLLYDARDTPTLLCMQTRLEI